MRQKSQGKSETHDVPAGFTLSMALMDALPVLFFSGSAAVLGLRFPSALFRIGAVLCIAAGTMKVLWKLIIALWHRDLPFLNRQLRVLMPAGFLLMVFSLFIDRAGWDIMHVIGAATALPAALFFLLGAAGIVLMSVFAARLDGRDARSNWIEQGTNTLAQLFIFLGILCA